MNKLNNQDNYQQMKSADEISRRYFMQKMVSLFGVTTATAVLSGCTVPEVKSIAQSAQQTSNPSSSGKLLSEHQMTVLYSLCDTILPKTNTPSAAEVGCHEFVQHQLQHCHTTQQKNNCIEIINKIDQLAEKSATKSFALIPKAQQRQLLVDIENNIGLDSDEQGQFMFLKALIVFGYFTSELGATKALSYQAVPGGFIGSIAANSETKSWGSLAYY